MSRTLWLCLTLIPFRLALQAQADTVVIEGAGEQFDRVITQQLGWGAAGQASYSGWKDILQLPDSAFTRYQKDTIQLKAEKKHWARVWVCNTSPTPLYFIFNTHKPQEAVLWQIQDGQLRHTQRTGFTTPLPQTARPDNVGSFPIYLPARSCQQWVLQWSWVDNAFRKPYSKPTAFALWSDSLATLRATDAIWNRAEYPMTVAVIGILGFLVLFMGFQYLQYGDKAYGAYALYCLGFCLFYLVRRNYWFDYPFGYLKPWRHYLDPYLSLFPVMAYVYFYQHFLSITRERHPHTWWVLQINKAYIAGLWLLFPILLLWLPVSEASRVYFFGRDLFIVGALYLVYLAFRLHTPLSRIFIAGTFALVFFSLLMVTTDTVRPLLARWGYAFPKLSFSFISNLQVGILLESVIFAYALSYRSRLLFLEKERLERQLVINKDRLRRARVSPYFTYNALEAVRSLLRQRKPDTATAYLVKFAGLLRYVLTQLERPQSSLARELDLCKRYMELEQLRRPGLNFQAQVEETIDPQHHATPSLLLQPLLEHALSNNTGRWPDKTRELKLHARLIDRGWEIVLTDKGADWSLPPAETVPSDDNLAQVRQRLSRMGYEATLDVQPLRTAAPDEVPGTQLKLRLLQASPPKSGL